MTSESLGLELPADGWEDSAGLYWASQPFSCKICFLDFAPVEFVPNWPNMGFGSSAA